MESEIQRLMETFPGTLAQVDASPFLPLGAGIQVQEVYT